MAAGTTGKSAEANSRDEAAKNTVTAEGLAMFQRQKIIMINASAQAATNEPGQRII